MHECIKAATPSRTHKTKASQHTGIHAHRQVCARYVWLAGQIEFHEFLSVMNKRMKLETQTMDDEIKQAFEVFNGLSDGR